MTNLQILLLDRDDLTRQGIQTVLEQDGFKITAAESLEEALNSAHDPAVSIICPSLAGEKSDGHRMIIDLLRHFPDTQMLVLSEQDSLEEVREFFALGAHGYFLTDSSPHELVEAVHHLTTGKEYLQPSLGAALLSPNRNGIARLTAKENEVLRVLALGYTNAEAASILCYAVRTVEGYKARIMRKLHIETRAEMVRAAAKLNLLNFADYPQNTSDT